MKTHGFCCVKLALSHKTGYKMTRINQADKYALCHSNS